MNGIGSLQLFITHSHECSYLDDRDAATIFVDPNEKLDGHLYQQLSEMGFRRSGSHVYRPHCKGCQACVPARIPVDQFQTNRRQRRCRNRNADLSIQIIDNIDTDEHYGLYQRYIAERHSDGDMHPANRDQFRNFLTQEWGITRFFELRLEGKLAGVVVSDEMENALSAVYTYFDPDLHRRSLGTFGILLQLQYAQERQLQYLYLGYWIKECQKMSYKIEYRPIELFVNKHWATLK